MDPINLTLTAECRAIERKHPGWGLHISEDGGIWAQAQSPHAWLRAASPDRMHHVIAEFEHALVTAVAA
jgi:hypothetical protein